MAASGVQSGEIRDLPQIAPQINDPQGPAAPRGASFEDHLNKALGKSSLNQADPPTGMKNQKSKKPGDTNPAKSSASNLQTPAIVAAPADAKAPSAKDGSSPSSSKSSTSQPASGNQAPAPDRAKGTDSQFSWLMQMMPDALGNQNLPPGAEAPGGASGKASGDAQSTPQTANGAAKTPAPGDSSDAAEALVKGTLAGKGKLEGAAAESSATATLISSGSGASSAQGRDSSQQGNALPASPSSHSSGQDVRLSKAVASLESLGLKLFSTSTPQSALSGADGSAASDARGGLAPSSASGVIHAHAPAESASQNARDASLLNSGGSPTGQAASSPAPAGSAAGTSGDPGKNGASPDSSRKQSGASSSPANGNSSSTPSAGAATGTSTAAQVAANGFAIPSNQAPGGNLPVHAPAQTPPSQATAAERMAAAENPLNPAGGIVNAASMLQAQGRTEMHVALHTESLGPLQLHAVLDGNRVGASIAVVNHEAHTLLTNELPALQQVLSDQNLRVEHLSVLNSPMHSGTGTGQGQNFHSGNFHQPRDNAPRWTAAPSVPLPASGGKETLTEIRRRLSVRA